MMLGMQVLYIVAVSAEVDRGFTFLHDVEDSIVLMAWIAVEALLSAYKDLPTWEGNHNSVRRAKNVEKGGLDWLTEDQTC